MQKHKLKKYYVETLKELLKQAQSWHQLADTIGFKVESNVNAHYWDVNLMALHSLAMLIGDSQTKDSFDTWTEWWFNNQLYLPLEPCVAYIGDKKYKIPTASKLYDFITEWLNPSNSTGIK